MYTNKPLLTLGSIITLSDKMFKNRKIMDKEVL